MLRDAKNAEFQRTGRLFRRHVFTAGRLVAKRGLRPAEYEQLAREQRTHAVAVLQAPGGRTYWWCQDRFYWEDDGLSPRDVLALVTERAQRAQKRLARAHAALEHEAQQQQDVNRREPIPRDVRRAVWTRDGGACVDCGEQFELQFDHVIPLALGGANTIDNLQVLCGDCNRAKGATVG